MRAESHTARLCELGHVPTRCDRKHNYIQKPVASRESLIPGQKNVVNTPLINPENIYTPPLHIKLGLIKKNLVKATDQNSAGLMYLKNTFTRISDTKIKEGVFI